MKDIENYTDLLFLVDTFYTKLKKDHLIKHFFNEIVELDFETHIPKIASFWDSILFGTQNFAGNPMAKHIELNKKSPLEKQHFDRWLQHRNETIDKNFEGKKATEAKERANAIASVILFKVSNTTV